MNELKTIDDLQTGMRVSLNDTFFNSIYIVQRNAVPLQREENINYLLTDSTSWTSAVFDYGRTPLSTLIFDTEIAKIEITIQHNNLKKGYKIVWPLKLAPDYPVSLKYGLFTAPQPGENLHQGGLQVVGRWNERQMARVYSQLFAGNRSRQSVSGPVQQRAGLSVPEPVVPRLILLVVSQGDDRYVVFFEGLLPGTDPVLQPFDSG